METPYTNHLTSIDFKYIYEPAEDSFLLLDALEADLPYIQTLEPCVCLEIGPGSGIIITALAKNIKNCICIATDINPYACKATKSTASHNSTSVDAINCNLVDTIKPKSIDLMVFNPPYVVTSDDELHHREEQHTDIEKNLIYSWAGGKFGRRIVDKLIDCLDSVLSVKGVLYLLLLRENKPHEVIDQLKLINFTATICMERRIPGEYLYILKVTRL